MLFAILTGALGKNGTEEAPWLLAGGATIFSILITLLAMFAGHLSEINAFLPLTLQMLFSNITFDAITMLATFWILRSAIGPNRHFSIPIAIILDLFLAAILACGSLWFGLVGTYYALPLKPDPEYSRWF